MSNAKDDKDGKVKKSLDIKVTSGKSEADDCESEATATVRKKYTLKDRMNDIKSGIEDIKKTRRDAKAQDCQEKMVSATAPTGGQHGRRMKYPYTITAKVAQFPFRFYYDNVWVFKYYLYAVVASFPVFWFLGKKTFAPENVEIWEKKRKALFEKHH